ncbi:peptidase M4 [Granulosicoccus antarcticus]|uniref:Uncharacterized protein n=1 Tax=Granulosicoccus antarcticus IMCC3135 TaxID=1192854 RepID=A0A2Z2NQ27_9GAMM|nr:peptidase M4 [Granulosicoccus antarcticus]ASJ70880.1 hypothetical protein IMCC3135_03835 [Granulosicoccus antarcticus IMCC3135]
MDDSELLDKDRTLKFGKARKTRKKKSLKSAAASQVAETVAIKAPDESNAKVSNIEPSADHQPGESRLYVISPRIALAWCTRLHERTPDEPLYRRLRVYSINPGLTASDSGIAICKVPFEPLTTGPSGSVMEVSNRGVGDDTWSLADLEHPHVVMQDGYTPSLSDPRFHQQMVYAVAMETYDKFRVALGRNVAWAFARCRGDGDERRNRLLLRPHGAEEPNAWYDRAAGEIVFGYFKARESTPVVKKGVGNVFTSVSHDVIVHETSHALLDGLRAHFMLPSHPDVIAFHEAFADLVAVFQHFTVEGVVQSAIGKCRGRLQDADVLVNIAEEFGRGLDKKNKALRTLIDLPEDFTNRAPGTDSSPSILCYDDAGTEAHSLGRVLARAVFNAFLVVYERRTRRYLKLATAGSGELPPGDLGSGLQDILVSEVRSIANQFLCICIRAIDYCPPVDVRFGDYLRALITADFDVVPDDNLGYREAIIKAFGQRGIFGEGTSAMTEDELVWHSPDITLPVLEKLSFSSMEFDGDPAKPVSVAEMRRQAGALGFLVSQSKYAREFGLVSPESSAFKSGGYALPIIESVRSARRVGVNKEVTFDTVAEVVQVRHVSLPGGRSFSFFGGATVIVGPRGNIRYIIRKRVDDTEHRMQEQLDFMQKAGSSLWNQAGTHMIPRQDLAKMMCTHNV